MKGGTWTAWTDERKDEVKRLWLEGRSAGMIGIALGVSRSAIIGIVHRNRETWGIGHRSKAPLTRKPRKPRAAVQRTAQPKATKQHPWRGRPVIPKPLPAPPPELPTTGTAAFIDLRPGQCLYPMSDEPQTHRSMYCGRPREGDDTPYCGGHRAICRQPLGNSRLARETREVEAA